MTLKSPIADILSRCQPVTSPGTGPRIRCPGGWVIWRQKEKALHRQTQRFETRLAEIDSGTRFMGDEGDHCAGRIGITQGQVTAVRLRSAL